jgi:glyoxylase-like metal-dependent hydrolase (beta-lactamase superfamily II)
MHRRSFLDHLRSIPVQIGSFDEQTPVTNEPDRPGVPESLAEGVWRIPLPLPFPPGFTNAYILHGEGQWVMVDCGLGTRTSDAALAAGLAALEIAPADLSALVLTHAHPDHIAPAGDLIAAMPADARVLMLDVEVEQTYRAWSARDTADLRSLEAMQIMGGMAPEAAKASLQGMLRLSQLIRLPPPERVGTLADDQEIMLGGRAWQALWTPGHSAGHMCLYTGNLIITGDHILPTISPNVSLHPDGRAHPIGDYLWGLDRVAGLELAAPLAMPGHGHAFSHLTRRIEELRASTLRRSGHALAALRESTEPATALEVAEHIFRGRLHSADDRWLALGETMAHLEHLHAQGLAIQEDRAGVAYFTAIDGLPEEQ